MSQIETLDWSAEEAILNPARHQKDFSSCWAMAACAATKAALAIRDKYEPDPLKLLSPQHLINNVSKYFPYVDMEREEYGCNMERAFLYMMSEGIPAEVDCIYDGEEGDCSTSHLGAEKFYIHSFGQIAGDDEEALITRVIQQPVVAGIMVTRGFLRLRSEVYRGKLAATRPDNDSNDDKKEVNNDNKDEDRHNLDDEDSLDFSRAAHAIVIVEFGYDDENKVRYWKVINSDGPGWGENGFGRICMNSCRPKGTEPILFGFIYPIV